MKSKSTLAAVEARFEERRKYFLDKFFQDEVSLEKAINAELWDECTVDFIRNRMMSFIREFYPLEDGVGHKQHIVTGMMYREGGRILDYLYREVRSEAGRRACELAEKEFPGIKEKRQRFVAVIERVKKSPSENHRSENHRANLAALYAFEEERMQYQDDLVFECRVTDDDFKGHIDLIAKRCGWNFNFSVDDAVKKARSLMKSGRMKGKNFRGPVVDAELDT